MQPLISIENVEELINEIISDIPAWRKEMIHYIKDENPELNAAIIELSQKSNLDPKALATGAYMTYKLLEKEASDDAQNMLEFDDEE
ncbi:MAG: hypothetical protein IKL52_04960 [Candidatus Gastranaerophilales bacterium]|jgi:hypothetical protein|nr:hypothetical protein [Candidatus Gastranaerophilales bacterium]